MVYSRTGFNQWEVESGVNRYVVSHRPGLWMCSCLGSTYRGACKHILAIQTDQSPRIFLPGAIPAPVELKTSVFTSMWRLPRFMAEPISRDRLIALFCGDRVRYYSPIMEEEHRGFLAYDPDLAGTTCELVLGDFEADGRQAYLSDCLVWKGTDLRGVPFRERFPWTQKLAHELKISIVPRAWRTVTKYCFHQLFSAAVMLRDVGAVFGAKRALFIEKGR